MPPAKPEEANPSIIMAPPTAAKRPHAAMSKANPPNIEPQQIWAEELANFDCSKYDYIPTDDGGFWRLQQHIMLGQPPPQLPQLIPHSATNRSPVQKEDQYICLSAACPSKPFKKNADLENHYRQAHADGQTQPSPALSLKDITPATSISNPSPKISTKANAGGNSNAKGGNAGSGNRNNSVAGGTGKEKDGVFHCDYPACNRRNDAFSRKDRFRIHLTEVHKEDVNKKGGDITDEWLQTRKIYLPWWRCTKCLERVKVVDSGYECPRDGTKCEDKRREFREKQAKLQNM